MPSIPAFGETIRTLALHAADSALGASRFHVSRLQRWSRDKQLSFVPPDGHFTLMEYRYAPSGLHQTAVPFALNAGVKIDENRGKWRHYSQHGLYTRTLISLTTT